MTVRVSLMNEDCLVLNSFFKIKKIKKIEKEVDKMHFLIDTIY